MNVAQDLSFLTLITNAHLIVQLIMALLVIISIMSWYYIFDKSFAIRAANAQTDKFIKEFGDGSNRVALYESSKKHRDRSGALARIFYAGMGEYIKGNQLAGSIAQPDTGAVLDSSRRAMRAAFQRELDVLDSHLNFLASVGSVSPYIGLLGTVWGIMNAFRGLANVQQATLAAVAPGIAEALIATAIGLFAAIPAVVAYNRYTHDIDRLAIRFERFVEEFHNILQHHSR
jgi:biopolymer transport protein TolQ